jgi:hypothetical protein
VHLESLTGVSVIHDGSETLGNSSLEESLDNQTRSFGYSSLTEWRMGSWTLDILGGWEYRSVDAAIRAAISPNALYHLGGSIQWWLSLLRNLSYKMDLSILPDSNNTSSLM